MPLPADDSFNALGDPNRRAIVELLGAGERPVQEIADVLPIGRPAVSRHLRLLKGAGLVVERPCRTRRVYQLEDHGIRDVEVRFVARDNEATTVEIEHRGWERLGADGERWRKPKLRRLGHVVATLRRHCRPTVWPLNVRMVLETAGEQACSR